MVQKAVDMILNRQFNNSMITNDKISIYRYGYTLLIETFINFVLALLIGIVFDVVFSVIIFLAFFVPLRSFCGGWHAESSFGCTVISSMIVLFVTLIYKNQWLGDNYLPMVILDVICMFLIILCKPQDSKSKSMSKKEKERCHRIVKMQLSIHLLVIAFMVYIDYCSGVQLFLMIHIVQALLLWCGRWKNEIEKRKVS